MIGIIPGQILSIGWGNDLEHFTVKDLGSIKTAAPLRFDHAARSPIKLVRNSSVNIATEPSGGAPPSAAPRTRKSDANSDVESDADGKISNVTSRKVAFPTPYPLAHRDLARWDDLLLMHITMGNPNNARRERQYWEKAFKWKSNDARLSETPVPPDMLALDVLIREKIKHIAQTSLPHTKRFI